MSLADQKMTYTIGSSLDSRQYYPLDKVLLGKEKDNQDREDAQGRGSHHCVQANFIAALQSSQPQGNSTQVNLIDDN
jgi:hypothetical protein